MEKIYLPFFGGFYNTVHSFDDEYLMDVVRQDIDNNEGFALSFTKEEMMKAEDDYGALYDLLEKYYEIDYKEYEMDYVKEYYSEFENRFFKQLKNIGIDIVGFDSIISPKEYNFDTDHINVDVEYDIKKIMLILRSHKDKFNTYIKEANTSYDGFMAYGTNNIDTYLSKTELLPYELTQIIDFYVREFLRREQEELDMSIYEDISGNISCINYVNEYRR